MQWRPIIGALMLAVMFLSIMREIYLWVSSPYRG